MRSSDVPVRFELNPLPALVAALAAALCVLALGAAPADALPTAAFSFSPLAPQVGQTVTFTSTSTADAAVGALPLTATWHFSDATTDLTGDSVTRVFATAGPVTVTLTVTDALLQTSVPKQMALTVAPPPPPPNVSPIASFDMQPTIATVGDTVTVLSTSSDPDGLNGQVASQTWDLDGDGRFGDANTPVATHRYTVAGTVTVRLRVRDARGATATATKLLSIIADKAPVAAFGFAPGAPIAGQAVTFTSSSSDPDGFIAAQAWDLDGNGLFDDAAGGIASRIFPAAGQFMVALRVTDDRGVSSTAFQTILVRGVAPPPDAAVPPPPGLLAPSTNPLGSTPGPGLKLLSPFPVVRIRGRILGGAVHVDVLSVRAPRGAMVRVRCRGRGCPHRVVTARAVSTARPVRLRGLERRYPAGAVLEVFVTEPGRIGKYVRFTIRRGRPPGRVDLCVAPGASRPSRCPSV